MMYKKTWYILICLVVVFSSLAILLYNASVDFFKNSDKVLALGTESFTDGKQELTYRLINEEQEGSYSCEAYFPLAELPEANTMNYSIIVYRLAGQSFKLYLNDTFLGVAGDYDGVQSSIWNGMYHFQFDKQLLRQTNSIKLEIEALYDIGLVDFPIIISNNSIGTRVYQWYQLFQVWIKAISLGVLFCCGLMMVVFYLFFDDNPRRCTFFYMAIALFLGFIYFIDYFSIDHLAIRFILYKKINITCLFLMISFITLSFTEYYRQPKWRIMAYITIAISFAGVIFTQNIQQFKTWYDNASLLLVANSVVWTSMISGAKNKTISQRVIKLSSYIIIIFLIPTTLSLISGNDSTMFYSIIHIMLLAFGVSVLSINIAEIKYLQSAIITENHKLKEMYRKSITDGLTGLYDYSYMMDFMKNLEPVYTVFIFDIDNLKQINDTYGHMTGNQAILMATETLKKLLPTTATMGRFGGDEFIIVQPGDSVVAYSNMEKVRLTIANTVVPETVRHITISIGMYIVNDRMLVESIIDYADQALYCAKTAGKNQLVNFNDLPTKKPL